MSHSPHSFGYLFRMTAFGESHGAAMGVVVEGCPAGVVWRQEYLEDFTQRRRPGGKLVSDRKEDDIPEILSGVFEGKTLGTPIAMMVKNKDQRSDDYAEIKENLDTNISLRPGHADDVWKKKFEHFDYRGGGKASGRETLSRVLAGAVAKSFVKQLYSEVEISCQAKQVGPLIRSQDNFESALEALLLRAKEQGQSYGGTAQLVIQNAPESLGEPVFLKLKSELARAMMSVGAVVGVELGAGFESTKTEGTQFHTENSKVYGGIRGGISTGEEIQMQIAVKPTSSVMDVAKKGRHDPCILLRALVVFEAMAWLVLADQILWKRLNRI